MVAFDAGGNIRWSVPNETPMKWLRMGRVDGKARNHVERKRGAIRICDIMDLHRVQSIWNMQVPPILLLSRRQHLQIST